MRTVIAAFSVAFLFIVFAAPVARAAPTEVNVRIEGRSETLFEGPVLTEGHDVKAFSDAEPHRCDGVNNGKYPTPGPTPTAASVDAMSIVGEGFDGNWYPGYDDYFITRWGPGGQSAALGEYWGLLVNNVYTNVGGCQYQLDGGDEVLWAYDAFKEKPLLALFPAGYAGGARPLTATAELGQPFEVEVDSYADDVEGIPPAGPERTGANPFEGAEVAPVALGAGGFETVDTASSATVETGADGRAEISFAKSGWNRIKATVAGSGGEESAIRSNRLDVCVIDPPAKTDCGPLPPDDLARTPPAEVKEPGLGNPGVGEGQSGSTAKGSGAGTSPATDPGQVQLQLPHLDHSRIARGLLRVSWRVLDAGVGIAKWTISSKTLGRKGGRYVTRASGTSGTSASLRLPPGAGYRLRITITDTLGRSSSATIGKVQVPA
ncbi:MAG TPA: hypothetical protein VK471_00130 [Solirubrobacterales bacterium]|nr:hypothetical protein [Solirubrobacterales bacterium]